LGNKNGKLSPKESLLEDPAQRGVAPERRQVKQAAAAAVVPFS